MAGEWLPATLGEITTNYDAQRVPIKESERKSGCYPYYEVLPASSITSMVTSLTVNIC